MTGSPAIANSPPPLGAVVCPSCRREVAELGKACPHCGYTAADCVAKFPFPAPRLEPVLDASGWLAGDAQESLADAIADLQGEFPQVGLWICLVHLDPGVRTAEFGFWMMNACPAESSEDAIRRLHGLLLLVDTANHRLSLTLGYRLEQCLEPAGVNRDLDSLSAAWAGLPPGQALLDWVATTRVRLREAWARPRQPGNY